MTDADAEEAKPHTKKTVLWWVCVFCLWLLVVRVAGVLVLLLRRGLAKLGPRQRQQSTSSSPVCLVCVLRVCYLQFGVRLLLMLAYGLRLL
jgi:hypothetical protein